MYLKRKLVLGGIALLVAFFAVTVISGVASAHEKRHVGPYTFVVGFLNEPAYANQENSLDLTICNGNDCNYTVQQGQRVVSNPVMNADQTLKAEVIMGSAAPLALPLEPRYANPGKYSSYFVPSKTGTYTFHIFGTLQGMQINEKFTSSPNTFSDVGEVHIYPVVPTQNAANSLQAQVESAQQSAATATMVGVAGAVLGLLGLVTAGIALLRKPQSGLSAPANGKPSSEKIESLRG